jgi:hypothetical protein
MRLATSLVAASLALGGCAAVSGLPAPSAISRTSVARACSLVSGSVTAIITSLQSGAHNKRARTRIPVGCALAAAQGSQLRSLASSRKTPEP